MSWLPLQLLNQGLIFPMPIPSLSIMPRILGSVNFTSSGGASGGRIRRRSVICSHRRLMSFQPIRAVVCRRSRSFPRLEAASASRCRISISVGPETFLEVSRAVLLPTLVLRLTTGYSMRR